jgi:hypothetical protein
LVLMSYISSSPSGPEKSTIGQRENYDGRSVDQSPIAEGKH